MLRSGCFALRSEYRAVVCESQPLLSTLANVHTCYGLRGNKERFKMALLTGYFDESGIHEGDHACVVAGFVGNDAQWHAVAADWIPAIRPRQNLHMKKLKWNRYPDRISKLLSELGPIPHNYNLKPVAIGLKWSDYNSVVKGKLKHKLTHPYMMCAVTAISQVLVAMPEATVFTFFLTAKKDYARKQCTGFATPFLIGLVWTRE